MEKKDLVNLGIMKFVSVWLPYLWTKFTCANEAKMFGEIGNKYFEQAMDYYNEAYVISWPFLGLFLIVELLWFIAIAGKYEKRKELVKSFIIINVIFLVALLVIDYVVCRSPLLA